MGLWVTGELPRVSVVAPTYGRRATLPRFVEPLLRQPVAEVVVAVDGSADGSVAWLRERARDEPRLVPLDLPNRGVGAARQAGLEAATGDVVLLLDDDVIASPGLVEGHARHHVDGVPKLVLGYMPNDWRAAPRERRAQAWLYRKAYEEACARFSADPRLILRALWGGNLSMRREDMLRVGIANLAVARGVDDVEFGLRCMKAGVAGVFDPSLHALHDFDRSFADFRRESRVQGESRRMLRAAHADVIGDDPARSRQIGETVGMGLPPLVRRVWPLLARDPLFGPLSAGLTIAHRGAVRLDHLGLEAFVARGVSSLEVMRGALDASARLAAGESPVLRT